MRALPFPVVTLALTALLVAAFGLELSSGVETFCLAHGFDPEHLTFTRALGSLALHAGFGHLFGNLIALVVVGTVVEPALGGWAAFVLFLSGGLGGVALHALLAPSGSVLVGASGGIGSELEIAPRSDRAG